MKRNEMLASIDFGDIKLSATNLLVFLRKSTIVVSIKGVYSRDFGQSELSFLNFTSSIRAEPRSQFSILT